MRNLDDEVVKPLRIRAAEHGRSAEAEHRELLRAALLLDDRAEVAARLAAFRKRVAIQGGPSVAELLEETRNGRMEELAQRVV